MLYLKNPDGNPLNESRETMKKKNRRSTGESPRRPPENAERAFSVQFLVHLNVQRQTAPVQLTPGSPESAGGCTETGAESIFFSRNGPWLDPAGILLLLLLYFSPFILSIPFYFYYLFSALLPTIRLREEMKTCCSWKWPQLKRERRSVNTVSARRASSYLPTDYHTQNASHRILVVPTLPLTDIPSTSLA